MRKVQVTDAERKFGNLIKEVESGETIELARDGEIIARMVPGASLHVRARTPEQRAEIQRAIESIREIGRRNGPITVEEILSMRDEGRK
jgi:antitoxin (DNA-binding transcriptional repressor) of toxin-antitoxin stability system